MDEGSHVVLIVEDDTLVRLNAVDMVKDAGFKSVDASNADEALQMLESRSDIGLMFTDVQMPGSTDGLELAAIVRRRWPAIAILITSGRINVKESDVPLQVEFLSKPYSAANLSRLLCKIVAS